MNLSESEFPPGATYQVGDALVTMVSGYGEPPEDWGRLNTSERRNAGSVVIRLYYEGKSILFTGDTVGRHIGDSLNTCIAAERFMLDRSAVIPIDSDVIIAPHHGADNGSSLPFIREVSPEYVVFPAGSRHEHPRKAAVERYKAAGVRVAEMFRTDLGDNEGGKEWGEGSTSSGDKAGDDDVDILIRSGGELVVEYR